MEKVLSIDNLIVAFETDQGRLTAVNGVSLSLGQGEVLALVGESGCGKTVLCKSMLHLLCSHGRIQGGRILLEADNGEIDLTVAGEKEMEGYRGGEIAMIFQDPMTSLNPTMPVGAQIAEVLRLHGRLSRKEAKAQAVRWMELLEIDRARQRYGQMPHQLSGGMRQRIAIAIALAGNPKVLLADEPTTSLDVDTQKQILRILKDVQKKVGVATIFITHDLSLVEEFADRVAVMTGGEIVETGTIKEIFEMPKHPYTKRLLSYADYGKGRGHTHGAIHFHQGYAHGHEALGPHVHGIEEMGGGGGGQAQGSGPCKEDGGGGAPGKSGRSRGQDGGKKAVLAEIRGLKKNFEIDRRTAHKVLDGLSFDIYKGEVLGIVGPSGCGKSTLAKCLMGIYPLDGGEIRYSGHVEKQMIFQDSASAFNPRMTIGEIIGEPLRIRDGKRPSDDEIYSLMDLVELDRALANRRPYQVSGGQRQRAAAARAISANPQFIVADEPISSLDVSIQAQIIHLFKRLQEERNLTLVLIAHDLPMVQHISDRIITL